MPPPRQHLSAIALASVAALLGGCGGGSPSNGGVARLGANTGSSTATGHTVDNPATNSPETEGLVFAKCMRANGVPSFPDPKSGGGGFLVHASRGEISSPAFQAAQRACVKFMPGGGIGSGPPPSAQTVARFLRIAQCMRSQGVPNFPDPKTSAPSNPRVALGGGGGVISDIEGVILVFPGTINQQSPAFTHASAVCAFPLHNH